MALAALIHPIHFRVAIAHPAWRGRRGGAENDAQPGLVGQVDGVIEPFEIEVAFLRLQVGPAEFGHVGEVEAEPGHAVEVALPLAARPLLRVIEHAKAHRFALVQQRRALSWHLALATGICRGCRSGIDHHDSGQYRRQQGPKHGMHLW